MLLDAAVVMMQQYSSLATVSQQTSQPSSTATTNTTIPPNMFPPNLPTGSSIWNTTLPAESPKIAKVAPTTSSQVNPTTETSEEGNLDKPGTSKEGMSEETVQVSPEEEIRRRRLQKFQQSTMVEQPQD